MVMFFDGVNEIKYLQIKRSDVLLFIQFSMKNSSLFLDKPQDDQF